ncbi:hypothetical protein EU528_02195 [Candidatus Thorarchaeota archaeon]|nr:MAG: hypothetical protein EU528_02195 [Candidatus Thorarchaeota archaeon]
MRDSSTCPDCESPMQNGYIVGNGAVWWTREKPKVLITGRGGNIQLDRSVKGWAKVKAKRCINCNLVIIRPIL